MKLSSAVLALFLAVTTLTAGAADYTSARDYVYPVIVTKAGDDPSGSDIIGSGSLVVIAPGYAITSAHIVPDGKSTLFIRQIGLKPLVVVKIDHIVDLALVSGDFGCPCSPLAQLTPKIDEDVVAIGYPLFTIYQTQFATTGTMQGVFRGRIVATAQITGGSSGGGLFVKENNVYKLVGVLEAVGKQPIGPMMMNTSQLVPWIMFSVPASDIRQFLKSTLAYKMLK